MIPPRRRETYQPQSNRFSRMIRTYEEHPEYLNTVAGRRTLDNLRREFPDVYAQLVRKIQR